MRDDDRIAFVQAPNLALERATLNPRADAAVRPIVDAKPTAHRVRFVADLTL